MTLLYPAEEIKDYSKEQFINDVVSESIKDIRQCLDAGADSVQVDFTEARLSLKLDPSGSLLNSLLEINERVFSAFTEQEKGRLGIHVCPGADRDSTHSADVDYSELLSRMFNALSCKRFYLQMKSEKDPIKALETIKKHIQPSQLVFIGCVDVNDTRIETPEEICLFLEQAARYIPKNQLGCCDDCGFSPFADDVSTSRDVAFSKMKARIDGAKLASKKLFL
jgi:5-methyltetrahydropteroyltriglutamate--homocysteine methyltransferase